MKMPRLFSSGGVAALLVLAGCGSSETVQVKAVRPPHKNTHPAGQPWTLDEKIQAVQDSGMSPSDKKKEIASLQAAGG
jgi:hypothetical protein